MKTKKKELSSPKLKKLKKDLKKIEKAEDYLEVERKKLMKEKETIRNKIRKETEILRLKGQIERVKNREK